MAQISIKHIWQDALMSVLGPPGKTRIILFALSKWANSNGNNIFPSERRLELDLGISRKTIRKHLKIGLHKGWIKRKSKGMGSEKKNAGYIYSIGFPTRIVSEMREILEKEFELNDPADVLARPSLSKRAVRMMIEKREAESSDQEQITDWVG